jgi:hypothetical protein
MSFASDLNRFTVKLGRLTPATYVGVSTRVHASIVGDESGAPDAITGAPGQPVDVGFLKASYILAIGPTQATITTNAEYAKAIEDGIGPYGPLTLRSKVGGFHSIKQTLAGASALQADVVRGLTR